MKASVVGREFSLKKMEVRLGSFEPAREGGGEAEADGVPQVDPESPLYPSAWEVRHRERVRHRATLVLIDRQVAEQRENFRDDYRREVGDTRRHWPWHGGRVEWLREQAVLGDAEAIAVLEARARSSTSGLTAWSHPVRGWWR